MGNELPLSFTKFIKFVESVKHYTSVDDNEVFRENVKLMEANEEVYNSYTQKIKRKDINIFKCYSKLVKLKLDFNEKTLNLYNSTGGYDNCMTQADRKKYEKRDVVHSSEYYENLGKFLDENGFLDIMVQRNNLYFRKLGMPYISLTKERALEEFSSRKNCSCDIVVISSKITFIENKIVKFMDSLEYEMMYKRDELNAKSQNSNRNKFLSKFKTDFIKNIIKYCWLNDEVDVVLDDLQNEYERLFNDDFNNIDLKADLELICDFEFSKIQKYDDKKISIEKSILAIIGLDLEKNPKKEIISWGMCRDEKNKCMYGINLAGYPTPITVHVQQEIVKDIKEFVKYASGFNTPKSVPEYEKIYDKSGNIFRTNLLFKLNSKEREKIKLEYQNNPQNKYLKYIYNNCFSNQVKKESPKKINIKDLIDD